MKSITRVLFLTRYGRNIASSRQRFYQFVDYLEQAEIECTICPFFWPEYLAQRYKGASLTFIVRVLSAYIKRLAVLYSMKKYDLVIIQAELFPYLPAGVEKMFLSLNRPCLLDYDDAWFHHYDAHKKAWVRKHLGRKVPALIRHATGVIVGSRYLYEYARGYQNSVALLPTTIDLDRYPSLPPGKDSSEPFTVGWIGSRATAPYLDEIAGVLRSFCGVYNAKMVIIGGGARSYEIPNLTIQEWQEDTEVSEISKFDVGLMPLPDTPFSRGKCAFKLIQYMGCWKPVIGSPIGENNVVIEQGVNGFIAHTRDQWYQALVSLFNDREMGRNMGRQGRMRVEQKYSKQIAAPQLLQIIKDAVEKFRKTGR